MKSPLSMPFFKQSGFVIPFLILVLLNIVPFYTLIDKLTLPPAGAKILLEYFILVFCGWMLLLGFLVYHFQKLGVIIGSIRTFMTEEKHPAHSSIKYNDDLSNTVKSMFEKIKHQDQSHESYVKDLKREVSKHTFEVEQIQHQLIQAGKLAAVGELSAGIAHELNNPIGGILGYSQFLAEKLKKEQDSGDERFIIYSKYAEFISRESKRCKRIIENLLKFSRSSSMEYTPMNVNVVLADAIEIVQNQTRLDKIHIETKYSQDIPMIMADTNQIQQVFMNIIINAIKAIPHNRQGKIKIDTTNKLIKNESAVEITIADNGCGIPEKNISKIFDPFFTTRPTGEGTGLGLSLSYGIIKEHNGEIFVNSVVDVGTTFTIVFPSLKQKKAGNPHAS